MTPIHDIWKNYREEFFFFLLLSLCTVLSHWLSRFIPVDLFENVIILFQHSVNTAICFIGAFLLFVHSDGMRTRRACAYISNMGDSGGDFSATDLSLGSTRTHSRQRNDDLLYVVVR